MNELFFFFPITNRASAMQCIGLLRMFGWRKSNLEAAKSTRTSILIASARISGTLSDDSQTINLYAADRGGCCESRSCMASPALISRGFLIRSSHLFVHLDILPGKMWPVASEMTIAIDNRVAQSEFWNIRSHCLLRLGEYQHLLPRRDQHG